MRGLRGKKKEKGRKNSGGDTLLTLNMGKNCPKDKRRFSDATFQRHEWRISANPQKRLCAGCRMR